MARRLETDDDRARGPEGPTRAAHAARGESSFISEPAEPAQADPQPGARATARRVVRTTAAIAWTAAWTLIWFAGAPFTLGSRRRHRAWRARVFRSWARGMLAVLRVRVNVRGGLPEEPCLLVSNHFGYVDVLVLAAHVDSVFVSMKELESWPLFGAMARRFGTVFIDRARKRDIPQVNAAVERALAQAAAVVVFAEGRNTRGRSVLPFRPSLLEPAARGNVPVAWCVLHYATAPGDPPASTSVPWVNVPILRHARVLLALERVDASLEFGADVVRGADRKRLADELHARVAARFRPLA